jgi:hypothetical protein
MTVGRRSLCANPLRWALAHRAVLFPSPACGRGEGEGSRSGAFNRLDLTPALFPERERGRVAYAGRPSSRTPFSFAAARSNVAV